MRAFWETRARKGSTAAHLFVGEDQGHLVCIIEETEGRHTRRTHLQTGSGSYGLWRAYMTELSRLEEEEWNIQKRDMPRPSEVRDLHKEYSL